MVVGFTLRYGISGVPARQFGGIMTYDAEVIYDTDANEAVVSDIEAVLDANALPHVNLRRMATVYEMDGALSATTLIVAAEHLSRCRRAVRWFPGASRSTTGSAPATASRSLMPR